MHFTGELHSHLRFDVNVKEAAFMPAASLYAKNY